MSRTKVVAFYGCMLAIAVVFSAWQGSIRDWFPAARELPERVALGAAAGLFVVLLSRLCHRHFAWARRLSDEFQTILSSFSRRDALMMAVMSALGEEMLFRGLVQGSFPDPWFGLFLTASVFAALHVGPSRAFVPWTIMAFVVGLMFGTLLLVTGDLVAPIVAHGLINFLNLRVILGQDDSDLALGPLGGDPVGRSEAL